MNEKNVNECLYCGCYDEDFGCTMPSIDKWYACPLEADEEELREMFNMSNELIRKSEVLDLLDDLYELNWTNDDYVIGFNLGLAVAIDAVEELQPVNAVELPCKVGDKIFEVYRCKIYEQTVKGFTTSDRVELINCETKNFYRFELGKKVFLTRGEAEKALEDLKNG